MRAVLLTGHGGPEKLVYREDVPVPQVGAGEVLIRVGACGVNNTDIWTREGAYGSDSDPKAVSGWQPLHFPRIQGSDIVGRIVEVGPGVSGARVGERVIVDPTLYAGGQEGLLEAGYIGSERDGGFAEYCATPEENARPIRSNLSDAELATFPTAYVTGIRMLNRARLGRGETILITGASGGVGSALVQLARLRGARAVAVVSRGKEERARALGAEAVVTRDGQSLYEAVMEAVEGRPIDVVADVVGGPAFPTLLHLLRKQGRYVTAGAIAGPAVSLDLRRVYLKHLEIIGTTLGTHEEFSWLVQAIERGALQPLLARTYALEEIHQAQADFQEKGFFGKLVILVEQLPCRPNGAIIFPL